MQRDPLALEPAAAIDPPYETIPQHSQDELNGGQNQKPQIAESQHVSCSADLVFVLSIEKHSLPDLKFLLITSICCFSVLVSYLCPPKCLKRLASTHDFHVCICCSLCQPLQYSPRLHHSIDTNLLLLIQVYLVFILLNVLI